MDSLLDRRAFVGHAKTVEEFREGFVGDAVFNGCIAFVSWPRPEVERILPPALELAPRTGGSADRHPVAFVFGEQTRGAVMFAGIRLPMGVDFGEFAFAVPFVRHRGSAQLHTYVPRMLSSYFPAVWDGSIRYGYRKDLAKMSWQGEMFLVTSEAGALLFHAAVEPSGSWLRADSAITQVASVREAFSLPIVGCKADGSLVCAYWGWELTDAQVRTAASRICLEAPLLPGLIPDSSHHSPLTLEVRGMVWKLSLPMPCQV